MTRAFALGGDGVVLDLPREGDIDALHAACTTPLVHETLNVPWPYERPHAEGFIREYAPTVWASGVGEVFAVRESADGPMLGTLELRRTAPTVGNLGFHLFEQARGRGLMTRAVALLLDWAFAHGYERITWEAIAGNHASAGVARRLGFTFDGEAPSSVTSGRHLGRASWLAHLDKAQHGLELDAHNRPWWPRPGELPEAAPLPRP